MISLYLQNEYGNAYAEIYILLFVRVVFVCLFTVLRPAHLYGDVNTAGKGLQNLRLCPALGL
jgi:hypothetical protein